MRDVCDRLVRVGLLPEAAAGEDYDTTSGNNIKIAKGEDSTTVKVWTREDSSDEPDETFKLKISNVRGATEGDYTADFSMTVDYQ